MRQWEDYEKSSVPLDRRIYWFERMDGLPVVTPELQVPHPDDLSAWSQSYSATSSLVYLKINISLKLASLIQSPTPRRGTSIYPLLYVCRPRLVTVA
jgi:hypothetical protein